MQTDEQTIDPRFYNANGSANFKTALAAGRQARSAILIPGTVSVLRSAWRAMRHRIRSSSPVTGRPGGTPAVTG